MLDVSAFIEELKQAYTRFYNGRVKRKGPLWPLWQDRFKSVLLEEMLFHDSDLFVDLARLSGVPSGNELSNRMTNDFEVLVHEMAHLFNLET